MDVRLKPYSGKVWGDVAVVSSSDLDKYTSETEGLEIMAKKMGACVWTYSLACIRKEVTLFKKAAVSNGPECQKLSSRGDAKYMLKTNKVHTTPVSRKQSFAAAGIDALQLTERNNTKKIKYVKFTLERIPKRPPSRANLPASLQAMVCTGGMWNSFTLGTMHIPRSVEGLGKTVFSATIENPNADIPTQSFELHQKKVFGRLHAEAVIWRPKTFTDTEVIYVAFQCATPDQLKRIVFEGSALAVQRWEESDSFMTLGKYIGKKSEQLWTESGLGEALMDLAAEGGKKRFVFCGISHGSALGQVLSLRFELARKHSLLLGTHRRSALQDSETYSIVWNGYRVMADNGADMMKKTLGDRATHIIASSVKKGRVVTDAVPGIFKRPLFSDHPHTFLLDQDGIIRQSRTSKRQYPRNVGLNLRTLNKILGLHQTWHIADRVEKQVTNCGEAAIEFEEDDELPETPSSRDLGPSEDEVEELEVDSSEDENDSGRDEDSDDDSGDWSDAFDWSDAADDEDDDVVEQFHDEPDFF